jgi:hypothetical protein
MGGRPRLTAMEHKVRAAGGDDVIFDRVIAGHKTQDIMAEYDLSREMFYVWIKAGGPERKAAWQAAKEMAAHVKVEEGQEILDDPTPIIHAGEASLRAHRANYRKWVAEKWNKEDYGPEAGMQINLSAGNLHLDALRVAGFKSTALPTPEPEPLALPAEIVVEETPIPQVEEETADVKDLRSKPRQRRSKSGGDGGGSSNRSRRKPG